MKPYYTGEAQNSKPSTPHTEPDMLTLQTSSNYKLAFILTPDT